jgi:hypothetical protein
MCEDIHSFEDGIEFCLATVDDCKTIKEAQRKIEGYLAMVHEHKFEALRFRYLIFPDRLEPKNNGGKKKDGNSNQTTKG